MGAQQHSQDGLPNPKTDIQQSILEQAQAASATAAQTHFSGPLNEGNPLELTDSTPSYLIQNYVPPPAYGEIDGGNRTEKNGLGNIARVTDDGRVDIRISQVKHRLSQFLTPALHQQFQPSQQSRMPPPPYAFPGSGSDETIPSPPPLSIVIQVVGSRGDVQPFVALGKVVKAQYGHRVRLATHPKFKNFVLENGLEFFSIGGDPSRLMAFMVKNPRLMPGFRSMLDGDIGQQRRDVAEYIQGCWRSCYQAGDGTSDGATDESLPQPSLNGSDSQSTNKPFVADCIIANPPSFAHIHCAEKLGIPLHIMFTMPYSPTQAFPHPLANIQSSSVDPHLVNYMSYTMIELLSWQGIGDIINRFRAKCLALDPISVIWAPGMLHRLGVPHTYCWSPALIPKPKDWGSQISVSGFCFLESASDYVPPPDLQSFIDAGLPPVYIGFGSIVLDDPDALTKLIYEAARKTGQRILLSKGWGDVGGDRLQVPDNVFLLGNVPHDWLFQHVSCVVHHGGAGTTAAGIAAGRPTVIIPFFGDQPFWGRMVARSGAGPDPIPCKQLTADNLANAINFCLKPESLERAKELANRIAAESGSEACAQSFHQSLEPDRLCCTITPSRPAVWYTRRTRIRLSALAACTLANANLLDFHDLKLFRAQEYQPDEGPWDPISGGAAACYRSFIGMAVGVAEVPSETVKPLRMISSRNRPKSQESVSKIAESSEVHHARRTARSPTDPDRCQASSHMQKPAVLCLNDSDISYSWPLAPNTGSSSNSCRSEHQAKFHRSISSRTQNLDKQDSGTSKDYDMMRQTGVHTSKGLGRFVRAAAQTPMGISVGLTKGFHNLPKLWGDDTVRPQEQISDFKSGAVAVGREFGYGWYDGVTGLVTQPWRGAQREGATGFVKGVGKGIAGFATKPFAGFAGILGHTMKGAHKEMQKLFGNNVQTHIIASRVAQGYEEWLQSSDAEKQNVIDRWTLIQEQLKGKHNTEHIVEHDLQVHRRIDTEEMRNPPHYGHPTVNFNPSDGAAEPG